LFFHRFFQRRVDELVIYMEQEAIKLVEVFTSERAEQGNSKTVPRVVNR